MTKVSASDAKTRFGALTDQAKSLEDVLEEGGPGGFRERG